jgi:hypothetical protein
MKIPLFLYTIGELEKISNIQFLISKRTSYFFDIQTLDILLEIKN